MECETPRAAIRLRHQFYRARKKLAEDMPEILDLACTLTGTELHFAINETPSVVLATGETYKETTLADELGITLENFDE